MKVEESLMTKEKFCRESRVIQTHRVFPFVLNPFGALFGGEINVFN